MIASVANMTTALSIANKAKQKRETAIEIITNQIDPVIRYRDEQGFYSMFLRKDIYKDHLSEIITILQNRNYNVYIGGKGYEDYISIDWN